MAVGTAAAQAAGQQAAVDHTKDWQYPMEKDGWVLSHDAIRNDMTDFLAALNALEARLSRSGTLHEWEVKALQTWWDNFVHEVHGHHRHEEEIFFPAIKLKFELPAKVSDDHATLMKQMEECGQLIRELSADSASQEASKSRVKKLAEKFPAFQESMKVHLREEEEEVLPEFRKFFTPKENKALVDQILKEMKLIDVGWFMRSMTREQQVEWAKNEGIPSLVAKFVIFPNAPKYNKKFTVLLDAVRDGKEPPKPKSFLCFLWGA